MCDSDRRRVPSRDPRLRLRSGTLTPWSWCKLRWLRVASRVKRHIVIVQVQVINA